MEERLGELKRNMESDPGDEAAFRAYLSALQRAGQRDEAEAALRERFACPVSWHDMAEVSKGVRECGQCERQVTYASEPRLMEAIVSRGKCVAVDPQTLDAYVETIMTRRLPVVGTCVLEEIPRPAEELSWAGTVAAEPPQPRWVGQVIAEPPPPPPGFFRRTWRKLFGG